jgi:hypothetical protein
MGEKDIKMKSLRDEKEREKMVAREVLFFTTHEPPMFHIQFNFGVDISRIFALVLLEKRNKWTKHLVNCHCVHKSNLTKTRLSA